MQEQLQEPVLSLKQDVVTRWNSTYDMLQRISDVKNSLMSVITINYPDIENLTNDDVAKVKQACELLKVFKDCTEELSSEKQVTASKVVLLSQSLRRWCYRFLNNTEIHGDVQQMAEKLVEALNRRFCGVEENNIFAESTLLNPRFKTHGFSDKRFAENAKQSLIWHCEKFHVSEATTATAQTPAAISETRSSHWGEFDQIISRLESNTPKSCRNSGSR